MNEVTSAPTLTPEAQKLLDHCRKRISELPEQLAAEGVVIDRLLGGFGAVYLGAFERAAMKVLLGDVPVEAISATLQADLAAL